MTAHIQFFTKNPVAGVFLAIIFYCAQNVVAAPNPGDHWVGTWGSSQQLTEPRNVPPPPGLTSNTLRQVVHVSVGGKQLRVRFSNLFGTNPVTMSAVHLALSDGRSAIKTNSDRTLMFRGNSAVTIPAGESVLSDTFDFELPPLSDLAVTIHFDGTSGHVTGHPGSRSTSYLQAGDAVTAGEFSNATRTQHWYILNGIDVAAEASGASIVTLGDSITDGRGSGTDRNDRWPDNLARRLQADRDTANIGVLNEGIGGNCVLRGGLGPTALSRFERDGLSQSGVRWLIIFEGVNDVGFGGSSMATATNLVAAYAQFANQAHARNIKVYGATITPFGGSGYFTTLHEQERQYVNAWIRTNTVFDGLIDFDKALHDPQNPSRLLTAADSGDHLHPNERGYRTMGDAIDLKLFEE